MKAAVAAITMPITTMKAATAVTIMNTIIMEIVPAAIIMNTTMSTTMNIITAIMMPDCAFISWKTWAAPTAPRAWRKKFRRCPV